MVVNVGADRLSGMLLNLTDRYAVRSGLLLGGGQWLAPGQEVWAFGGDPVVARIPDQLQQQGVREIRDWLKLIVTTEECDASLLEQGPIDSVPDHRDLRRGSDGIALGTLLRRNRWRDLGSGQRQSLADWTTRDLVVETVWLADTPPAGWFRA
jgi:hypothetical protein